MTSRDDDTRQNAPPTAGAGAANSAATDSSAGAPASANSADESEAKLVAAVQEYTAAIEAGRRPNRREFLSRYPEIASELSACMAGLALVKSAAAQLSGAGAGGASTASEPDLSNTQPLGDFRLVREIGRGGMGVVYEAVQLTLNRRVAVKVLPLAAALDARHLQRFRNEAQAAAQLHHTNIVPVYAVGCERSVHFYAMQLIEGESLADVLRDLRAAAARQRNATQPPEKVAISNTISWRWGNASKPPTSRASFSSVKAASSDVAPDSQSSDAPPLASVPLNPASRRAGENLSQLHSVRRTDYFRRIAELGLQAAEALDYAHRAGVVHRDIKPSNLLLDIHGTLWITDFGLAQFYTDAGLTRTGDLVGTLRYMSPEQASGRAVILDQRTDIYSIGVTLYELLTLKQALAGDTYQTLLQEIGTRDPRPARDIDRTIPRELETILSKATAKETEDRYATAKALADDLRRFLQDEPILARPPSSWDKAVKWTRRHKSIALVTLGALLLTAMGLLISTLLIAREQTRTKQAYILERQQRELAESNAELAERNAALAERSSKQARAAVDDLTRVATEDLAATPASDVVRREILEESLDYYQSFIDDHKNDPVVSAELNAARDKINNILQELSAFQDYVRVAASARLLLDAPVKTALGMNAFQSSVTDTAVNGLLQNSFEPWEQAQLTSEQRRKKFDDLATQMETQLSTLLSPEQLKRLQQISRQVRGPNAFNDGDVIEALSLTANQRDAIHRIQSDERIARRAAFRDPHGPIVRGMPMEPMNKQIRDQSVAKIIALFTPTQKIVWADLIGEPFTGMVRDPERPIDMPDHPSDEGRDHPPHGGHGHPPDDGPMPFPH